jgi:hypothetical protein
MTNELVFLSNEKEATEEIFDFDKLEEKLQSELEFKLSELDILKENQEQIGNPDNLGKIVQDVVWEQFANQIGLDITDETLIQKYDREHPEEYKEVEKRVMKDKAYIEAKNKMKQQQQNGDLVDKYTGKEFQKNDRMNVDHVIPKKKLFDSARRKQAGLSVEQLANKEQNLQPTNESLNKSKGKKSNKEYILDKIKREKDLIQQNERDNKKIENSNLSDLEKKSQIKKNNKRLQDKLDADPDKMLKAQKEAEKAINKDIAVGAVKQVGKKAGKDALKVMLVSALFTLLKEIMNGLVRFFKSEKKSMDNFLSEMKSSIKGFLKKILSFIQTGLSNFIGTIVSEIFGPIVSTIKKLASVIKQSISSLSEAIFYLLDKKNRNISFSIKIMQVGKIIVAGLTGITALGLGEVIEKGLGTILPALSVIKIPLLGSLANIIGIFMGAIISGIIGAVAIYFIQKAIEKKMKNETLSKQIDKGNEVLATQHKIQKLNEEKLIYKKRQVVSNIKNRHEKFSKDNVEREEINKIYKEELEEYKKDKERNLEKYNTENIIISGEEQIKNQEKIEENFNEIASLLNSLID